MKTEDQWLDQYVRVRQSMIDRIKSLCLKASKGDIQMGRCMDCIRVWERRINYIDEMAERRGWLSMGNSDLYPQDSYT